MTNEKNTQNADMPTKDTRQYKHTPSKRKRLVGKIFALVGCFAVLLSCLVLPSSAVGISSGDAVPDSAKPWNMPDQITMPIYGWQDTDSYIILDVPYAHSQESTQWYEDVYIQHDDSYRYIYHSSYNTLYDSLTCSFVNAQSFLDKPELPTVVKYGRFNYTEQDRYFLPGYDEINSYKLNWNLTDRLLDIEYDIGYIPIVDGVVGEYVNATRNYEVGSNACEIDLYGFFTDIGILRHDAYIEYIDIGISIDSANVYPTGYEAKYESGILEMPLYATKYTQVINEGQFSNLFDWLGSTVSGFFDASLFTIGGVTVTPAIILGAVLSFLLIFAFLRFFSGG